MTPLAMSKTAIAIRNNTPGLLDRNTANGLSPFMYIAVAMTAIDISKRKREPSKKRSLLGREA
jgi:hypothetical protein